MRAILFVFICWIASPLLARQDLSTQEETRLQEAARLQAAKDRALSNNFSYETFYRQAVRETDSVLEPLFQECAAQTCVGAGKVNVYLVRLRADGTFAEAVIQPAGPFNDCAASALTTRARLASLPPEDDFWLYGTVQGDRLPEECGAEIHSASASPAWYSVKTWLFFAHYVVGRAAFRMRVYFAAAVGGPFLLAILAWKLLIPGEGIAMLMRRVGVGALLVVVAAGASYAVGGAGGEYGVERRQNDIVTVMVFFPILTVAPLAWSSARAPLNRGGRASALRRYCGLLVLAAAVAPSVALAWFGIHENVRRVCSTCLEPMMTTWLNFI